MSLDLSIRRGDREVWWRNMTHNLAKMAGRVKSRERTLYDLLWQPPKRITKDYIEDLGNCLEILKDNEKGLVQFNPPNGWGTYEDLLNFTQEYYDKLTDLGDTKYYTLFASV